MNNYKVLHAVVQGASHKDKNKPCQDAALSYSDLEKGFYIIAVSDGHGSESHFLSDSGSKIATEVAVNTIKKFLEMPESKQLSVPFSDSGKISLKNDNPVKENKASKKQKENGKLLQRLISSLISHWNISIEKHWQENRPSADFMKAQKVPDETIKDYLNDFHIENAYGCTLMAFAISPDFWFGLQIGDGTCMAFNNKSEIFKPIPNDERFTGSNKTASLCNDDAIDNFRYCYGNNLKPAAVFLASDGMDGVYSQMLDFSEPKLSEFYSQLIKKINDAGFKTTVAEIKKVLPQLSAKGVTRDDISIAAIIDLVKIKKLN